MRKSKPLVKKIPQKKPKKQPSLVSLQKKVQVEFNAFIRRRDAGLPCISCGEMKENIQAGHYFPVKGFSRLRYREDNVHNECQACNGFSQDHLIWYRYNLIKKIGPECYQALEDEAWKIKKSEKVPWTRKELEHLLNKYKNINKVK